jgi:hypothetical protein
LFTALLTAFAAFLIPRLIAPHTGRSSSVF